MAIDRGRLSIADHAVDFFPGYRPIANLDERKGAITVRDLLTMRTGLDWSEGVYPGSPPQQLNDCRCDWLRFILDWPMCDMAKIGQLVLDGGRWRGTQIVSESWIRESTQPRLPSVQSFGAYGAAYGYLWWALPRGIITASGAQGQWIFVIPSMSLVVVVTGESDANFLSGPDLLYNHVLPAVRLG